MRVFWPTLGVCALFSCIATAEPESRITVNWQRVLTQGMSLLKGEAMESAGEHKPQPLTNRDFDMPWFGVAPRVSIVARDWGEARKLAGSHLSLTDKIRMSRSIRMVIGRARLSEGRFVPFAQMGLGQWRADPEVVPVFASTTELAGELGGGFELRLTRKWSAAVESDYFVLYRENHEPQDLPMTHIFGTFAAMNVEF